MPAWSIVASAAYLYVVIGVSCGWRWLASLHFFGFLCLLALAVLPIDLVTLRWSWTPAVLNRALITWIWSVR